MGEARLRNCEIPFSEEEWRSTPTALKWETLGNLKFAYHGEKKVEIEVDTPRVAPVSAKPTPPKPPPPFSSDQVVGKGAVKGKGKTGGSSDPKGSARKGQDSKGKDDSEGKDGKEDSKWGKTLAEVEKEDRDATARHYSAKTAREENWGPAHRRRAHSYHKWQSENDWVYVDGTWKWGKSPKPDEAATIDEETRYLGFGEFAEWAYAAVLTQKQRYAQFQSGETNGQ